MKRTKKKVRNYYAIEAQFRNDAGPMEKLGKMKNKAERKKIKMRIRQGMEIDDE